MIIIKFFRIMLIPLQYMIKVEEFLINLQKIILNYLIKEIDSLEEEIIYRDMR